MPPSLSRFLPGLLLALLAGCSLLEPEYAGVVVRFREADPLGRERLVVTLTSGRIVWYLEGTDLAADGDGWLASRELRVPRGGDAELLVALRGEGSEPAATGAAILPLEIGGRARVDIFSSGDELPVACDGCAGIARFPIVSRFRPSARDWLYLRWTGTATPSGPTSLVAPAPTPSTAARPHGVPSKESR